MSNYYYEDGAKHYDHHKEVTVNLKSATDAKSILREILADDIEDTDYEEIGFADEYAEQPATSEPIRTAHRNSGGGRKPESLFNDESITEDWAKKFNAFLNKHNKTGHQ